MKIKNYLLPAALFLLSVTTRAQQQQRLNTGWETSLAWNDRIGAVKYNVRVTLSDYRVKITKWNNPNKTLSSNYEGQYEGDIWGLQSNGLFQSQDEVDKHAKQSLFYANWHPGDVKYEDLNGDGVINESDKTVIGNAYPDLDLGLNIRVGYKGFDLAVGGFGRFGHEVFWVAKKWLEMGSLGSNVLKGSINKAWNGDGSTNAYPRFINDAQDANNNLKSSNSWFIEKGNYFRFNNIQLGYTLNSRLTEKIRMKKLRAYVNLQNIWTITSYKGLNPEIFNNDFGLLSPGFDLSQAPTRKAVTFGLSVGL